MALQTIIKGQITDSLTGLPVEGARIIVETGEAETLSDRSGNFTLRKVPDSAAVFLIVSHLNYHIVRLKYQQHKTIHIKLRPKSHVLTEVSVLAHKRLKPEKIKPESVLDYVILGNRLYVLSWETSQKNPVLQALDLQKGSLHWSYRLPFYADQLFADCLQNLHILTEISTYQLDTDSGQVSLFSPSPRSDYETFMLPCLTAINKWVYFRQNLNKGVISSFFAINQNYNEPKLLCVVQDETVLKMQEEEKRFQFFRAKMAEEAGNASAANIASNAAQSMNFAQRVLFRGPYIPFLKIGQEVSVFDHVNGKLQFYREDKLSRTVPINYHLQKHWSKQVIVDDVQEKAYTTFTRNGITELRHINLYTGVTENSYVVPNPFAHKIAVVNDVVYFLFKDPKKDPRQFLYRAPLHLL